MRSYPLEPKFLSQVGLPSDPETHIPRLTSQEFSVSLGGPEGAKVTFRLECSQYLRAPVLPGQFPSPRF